VGPAAPDNDDDDEEEEDGPSRLARAALRRCRRRSRAGSVEEEEEDGAAEASVDGIFFACVRFQVDQGGADAGWRTARMSETGKDSLGLKREKRERERERDWLTCAIESVFKRRIRGARAFPGGCGRWPLRTERKSRVLDVYGECAECLKIV
jgi:hypothetical protein